MTSNAGTDTDRQAVRRPGYAARSGRAGRGVAAGTAEDLQAGVPRPGDGRSVFPAVGRDLRRSSSCSWAASAAASRRTTRPTLTIRPAWSTPSPGAAREADSGARNIEHILSGRCCRSCRRVFSSAWRRPSRSPGCMWASMTPANFPTGSTNRRAEPGGTDREHAAISGAPAACKTRQSASPVTPVTWFARWIWHLTAAG